MEKQSCIKIAVIGAESTGKTELCEALAKHYQAALVPEFARIYFQKADINNYQIEDLEKIAKEQIQLEQAANESGKKIIICDTNLITIKIWAELEFNACPNSILQSMQQGKPDFYLITANDLPWQKDPLRQNKFSRDLIFERNIEEIKAQNKSYAIVKGANTARLQSALIGINTFLNQNQGL